MARPKFLDQFDDFITTSLGRESIIVDLDKNDIDDEDLRELCIALENLGYLTPYYHPDSPSLVEYRPFTADQGQGRAVHSLEHLTLALRYGKVVRITLVKDDYSQPTTFCISAEMYVPGSTDQTTSSRVTGLNWSTIEECRNAVYDLVRINPSVHVTIIDSTLEITVMEMKSARSKKDTV